MKTVEIRYRPVAHDRSHQTSSRFQIDEPGTFGLALPGLEKVPLGKMALVGAYQDSGAGSSPAIVLVLDEVERPVVVPYQAINFAGIPLPSAQSTRERLRFLTQYLVEQAGDVLVPAGTAGFLQGKTIQALDSALVERWIAGCSEAVSPSLAATPAAGPTSQGVATAPSAPSTTAPPKRLEMPVIDEASLPQDKEIDTAKVLMLFGWALLAISALLLAFGDRLVIGGEIRAAKGAIYTLIMGIALLVRGYVTRHD